MAACPDGRCDGSGFLYDETTRRARDCSCRPRRIARRKARKLAGVIPRRYQGVSLRPRAGDADRADRRARGAPVRRHARAATSTRASGIWFQGDVGTGKTTLAMLISAEALRAGPLGRDLLAPAPARPAAGDVRRRVRGSLVQLLDRLAAVELLHIDDVGAEQSSPWVLEQLYTIVNTRYEDGRAIVLTTNLDARRAARADRRAHGVAAHRDVRRPAAAVRRRPAHVDGRSVRRDDEPLPYGAPRARRLAS